MEYKMEDYELCKLYERQQYHQSKIRKMLHTQRQECHLLQCWGIFYLHEEVAINEWEGLKIIFSIVSLKENEIF